MTITLRVNELDSSTAARFEETCHAVTGVLSVESWEGKAELRLASTETLSDVLSALQTNGFNVDEPKKASVDVIVAGMSCDSCETLLESTIEKAFPGVTARANSARGIIHLEGTVIPDAASLQSAIGTGKYRVASPEERPSLLVVCAAFATAGVAGLLLGRIDAVSRLMNIGDATSFGGAVALGLFAGSSACMAVAGGIMLAVLGRRPKEKGKTRILPVGSFVVGRVASYAVFGALIGTVGAAIQPPAWATGALIFVAAVIMIVSGLNMLGIAPRWLRSLIPRLPHAFRKRADEAARGSSAPFLAGAATFFVPCGFTQALQFYALSSGSASLGGSILGGFALGTAPALFIVGWAARSFKGKKAQLFMRFAGAAVVLLGLGNIPNAAAVAGYPLDSHTWFRTNTVSASAAKEPLPPLSNGVQVIRMTAGADGAGYSPDRFVVRAGIPVEWHVAQHAVAGCLSSLVSRPLNVQVALVKGENIVRFTAPEPGTYGFSCGMGMFRGDIVAVKS